MLLLPLTEGRILRRYKRFLADVALCDGTLVTAHVPNTGSMATCWAPGARVELSRSPQRGPGRGDRRGKDRDPERLPDTQARGASRTRR